MKKKIFRGRKWPHSLQKVYQRTIWSKLEQSLKTKHLGAKRPFFKKMESARVLCTCIFCGWFLLVFSPSIKKNMTTELKQGSTTHYCRVISLKKDINSRESYFFKLSMSMLLSLSFSVFHKFDTNWCNDQFEASASLTGKTPRMDDVQMPVGCLTVKCSWVDLRGLKHQIDRHISYKNANLPCFFPTPSVLLSHWWVYGGAFGLSLFSVEKTFAFFNVLLTFF